MHVDGHGAYPIPSCEHRKLRNVACPFSALTLFALSPVGVKPLYDTTFGTLYPSSSTLIETGYPPPTHFKAFCCSMKEGGEVGGHCGMALLSGVTLWELVPIPTQPATLKITIRPRTNKSNLYNGPQLTTTLRNLYNPREPSAARRDLILLFPAGEE